MGISKKNTGRTHSHFTLRVKYLSIPCQYRVFYRIAKRLWFFVEYRMFFKIIIIACVIPITSWAAVYSWTDKNGTKHFSDEPQSNAVIVENNPENIARTSSVVVPKIENKVNTKKISIVSPKNEETIHYDNGKLTVKINVALNPNDKIILLLDGKEIATSKKFVFSLKNIERGAHTLQAQLFAKDKLIGESKITTFFMHQTMIKKEILNSKF